MVDSHLVSLGIILGIIQHIQYVSYSINVWQYTVRACVPLWSHVTEHMFLSKLLAPGICPALHYCKKIDGFSLLKIPLGLRRHWGKPKGRTRAWLFRDAVTLGKSKMHDLGMTFTRTCSCNMPMCHDYIDASCMFFPSGGRWALFQTRQALLTDLGLPSKRFTKSLPKLFFELIDLPCMSRRFCIEWTRTCVVTFHRKSWEVLRRSSIQLYREKQRNKDHLTLLTWFRKEFMWLFVLGVFFFDNRTRNILHITWTWW